MGEGASPPHIRGDNVSKDKLIDKIMAECAKDGEPVTREEAAEMAEMELLVSDVKSMLQQVDLMEETVETVVASILSWIQMQIH